VQERRIQCTTKIKSRRVTKDRLYTTATVVTTALYGRCRLVRSAAAWERSIGSRRSTSGKDLEMMSTLTCCLWIWSRSRNSGLSRVLAQSGFESGIFLSIRAYSETLPR
jgi:hypothetical protein